RRGAARNGAIRISRAGRAYALVLHAEPTQRSAAAGHDAPADQAGAATDYAGREPYGLRAHDDHHGPGAAARRRRSVGDAGVVARPDPLPPDCLWRSGDQERMGLAL